MAAQGGAAAAEASKASEVAVADEAAAVASRKRVWNLSSVQKYRKHLIRMIDIVKATMFKQTSSPSNAFLRTEVLLGWILNRNMRMAGQHMFMTGLGEVRNEVSVLPPFTIHMGDVDRLLPGNRALQVFMDDFAMHILDRMPDYDSTGIARLVFIPSVLTYDDSDTSHMNMFVMDRMHKMFMVVEPHGKAYPQVLAAAKRIADVYSCRVFSALEDGYGY
jgi:hypothetical protein